MPIRISADTPPPHIPDHFVSRNAYRLPPHSPMSLHFVIHTRSERLTIPSQLPTSSTVPQLPSSSTIPPTSIILCQYRVYLFSHLCIQSPPLHSILF